MDSLRKHVGFGHQKISGICDIRFTAGSGYTIVHPRFEDRLPPGLGVPTRGEINVA